MTSNREAANALLGAASVAMAAVAEDPDVTPGEVCCVCGGPDVVYRNYRDQPFCWPCGNPVPKPRLRAYFEKRDAWVGVYVARDAVYVCPLPFLVFRWWRRPRLTHRQRKPRRSE